jgi:CUG-BP- and ETR3-like factor
MNEEDIFPTFDSFGPLKDVAVIRDKHTGLHRGCAFVTYWSVADAESARAALHDQFTFPGAKRATQVKPAEPSGMSNANLVVTQMGFYGGGGGGDYNDGHLNSQESYLLSLPVVAENKLFVGMLARTCDEQDVRNLFSRFGEISEVYMIRNADGSSKCAAFLRFELRESAIQAIEQLNGVEVMDGAQRPLIVKFADSKFQRQQRHHRNARRQEMMAMVVPGGYPYHPPSHHHLAMGMHPSAGPPTYSMSPTSVPPPTYAPAAAYGHNTQAPQPPHHPHHHHQLNYMYSPSSYSPMPPHPYAYQLPLPPPQRHETNNHRPPPVPINPRPREGPAGANLFVYHLPHDLTDADLATAFNPFGNVISAKVYVDKYSGESKGFGT